jgi:hypothetical protein
MSIYSYLYLMGTADEVHVMLFEEILNDRGGKCDGDSSIILSPAISLFIRV